MLIYSRLAKPLEMLSLYTCLRCQSPLMHHLANQGLGLRGHEYFDLELGCLWKSGHV